jgi:CubicO group peptidase (beta-lactamase class C family)
MIAPEFIASSPEEIGIDPQALERLTDYVQSQVDAGLPSAQVSVGRHGQLASVAVFGEITSGGETRPASDDTLYCIYSSTKGIVGVAGWALVEDGLLDIDEHVADIVPQFQTHGKEIVTVRQVLTHTAGFPYAPMHPDLWEDRDKRLERMEYWRLTWEPGSRFEYHATAAHWTLAEIITQRTGLDFREYVSQRLTEPMGVPELFVGLPDEIHSRAADVVYTDPAVMPEAGWSETNPDTVLHFNLPSQRRAGCPGAGAFAGAGELALFYQRLVNSDDSGLYSPLRSETIDYATEVRTQAHHVDEARGLPVNRALAVVVAGDYPVERGFAPNSSKQAFGHGGAGGQISWGDPVTGLSVGFVTNGFVPPDEQQARTWEINRLAGACVAD